MSRGRTDMHRLQELLRLCRMGLGDRRIARTLRMGRDTVRTYRQALERAGILEGPPEQIPDLKDLKDVVSAQLPVTAAPVQQSSSVAPWLPRIRELWKNGAGPTAIHDRLRLDDPEYGGSLSAVKRQCLRFERERGVRPDDVAIPVETLPGEFAYVDFGYAGLRYDPSRGLLRKSWIFVMTLGFSRHMVCYLVFDQKLETWLRLHIQAFQELGGVPEVVVPDNLKAAIIRAAFGVDDDPVLQRSYRELARHYGFRIEPTMPRTPEHKGKVESGVKYVKNNFLRTHESIDLRRDQEALNRWLIEIAGLRKHGTTGRPPKEVFESEERSALRPLPKTPYALVVWKNVRLHRDCHVQIEGAFYSAPWPHLEKQLWARCTPEHVTIYLEEERIADHARVARGQRSTKEEHLPEHRSAWRHRSRWYWERKAEGIGPFTAELVRRIFDSDDVLTKLRPVQAIVTHLQPFPLKRAEAACERALYFGCLDYASVRNILRKGLDQLPLPVTTVPAWSSQSRFARSPSDRLLSLKGRRP